ncbi:MAG: malto-oligosyltrehalose trehalohydrolase [Chlamydiales bacterium 38-26]|nr:malto-oligosyltrehalose trehalohydrolase [Chlamydiales bacterium]OJV09445.1 MAG: malto-oligosyltrehalose trehalohydrolase [Chlamydiales bacterium 38-26]
MHSWSLKRGAYLTDERNVRFTLWAPKAEDVEVLFVKDNQNILSKVNMKQPLPGYFEYETPYPLPSLDYFYRLNHKHTYPDPVSRFQPFGVHGPSRFMHSSFAWQDQEWRGIPLKDYLIYELHVGTFTPEGAFEAIIAKLPYLCELGITAIELMPVVEFPGTRNWGYDGVCLYAPHHHYGGPQGLKKLINACHLRGLAVILDVVYNHLGPEGNYLDNFGDYFTDLYKTPWGSAINYDGPRSDEVRRYFIDNALYWLTDYHIDALRLDAVHAIYDSSTQHFLKSLSSAFHLQADYLQKKAFIIAESDLNDIRVIDSDSHDGYNLDAQWSDDFHHAQQALITKSQWQYFKDFGSMADVAKAIKDTFIYDGRYSLYREKNFGSSSIHIPGDRFIICIQNHDQIGNASQGKRLGDIYTIDQYKLASMLLLISPNLPLLFMGQEWNAKTPFLFFTDFEDKKLGDLVRDGYQKEFNLEQSEIFNPQNNQRFIDSKISWEELKQQEHQEILNYYKKLIQIRKSSSCLSNNDKNLTQVFFDENKRWLIVSRKDLLGAQMIFAGNFSNEMQIIPLSDSTQRKELILSSNAEENSQEHEDEAGVFLLPWSGKLYRVKL